MKQSEPLALVDAGTLVRPGPLGRLLRLSLGALCLYVFVGVFYDVEWTTIQSFSSLDARLLVLLPPLFVFNYVVNIGFSRSWGQRPFIASVIALTVFGAVALLATGSLNSPLLGIPLNLWLGYFYGHLGLSFVLSALIATPGCEMRAIPELFGRLSGKPSQEHTCPVAFITKIDEWEHSRSSG